jgi:hypothetical protein
MSRARQRVSRRDVQLSHYTNGMPPNPGAGGRASRSCGVIEGPKGRSVSSRSRAKARLRIAGKTQHRPEGPGRRMASTTAGGRLNDRWLRTETPGHRLESLCHWALPVSPGSPGHAGQGLFENSPDKWHLICVSIEWRRVFHRRRGSFRNGCRIERLTGQRLFRLG